MSDMQELIEGVKKHAQDHYDAGWDVIVETYEDVQIKGILIGADTPVTTVEEAIEEVRPIVSIWVDALLNTRPGEDDDQQLVTYNNYRREAEEAKEATRAWAEKSNKAEREWNGGVQPAVEEPVTDGSEVGLGLDEA